MASCPIVIRCIYLIPCLTLWHDVISHWNDQTCTYGSIIDAMIWHYVLSSSDVYIWFHAWPCVTWRDNYPIPINRRRSADCHLFHDPDAVQTPESCLSGRCGLLVAHVGDGRQSGRKDHFALLPSLLLLLLLRLPCPLALNCRWCLEEVTPFWFWSTKEEKEELDKYIKLV